MSESSTGLGIARDRIVRRVEPVHLGEHSAKYVVYTWTGRRHYLQVYERGGVDKAEFEFEVDGDLAERTGYSTEAQAFAAGLDSIRARNGLPSLAPGVAMRKRGRAEKQREDSAPPEVRVIEEPHATAEDLHVDVLRSALGRLRSLECLPSAGSGSESRYHAGRSPSLRLLRR